MRIQAVVVGIAMMASVACVAAAQEAAPAPKAVDQVAMVKESLAASKAALKQYEWIETTALSLKGEEKVRQQYRCYYGAEGAMQKVPLAPDVKEEKKRGLRGKAVEAKKAELQASMKDAIALLRQYAPLDPVKIQAAKDAGNVSVSTPDPDGGIKVIIKNYLKAGDEVTVDIDGTKNTLKGFGISSYVGDPTAKEKGPVTARIDYAALPDGTLYPAKETVEISAQGLSIDVRNSGYKKQG